MTGPKHRRAAFPPAVVLVGALFVLCSAVMLVGPRASADTCFDGQSFKPCPPSPPQTSPPPTSPPATSPPKTAPPPTSPPATAAPKTTITTAPAPRATSAPTPAPTAPPATVPPRPRPTAPTTEFVPTTVTTLPTATPPVSADGAALATPPAATHRGGGGLSLSGSTGKVLAVAAAVMLYVAGYFAYGRYRAREEGLR